MEVFVVSLTLASIAFSLLAQAGPAAAPAGPPTPVSVTVSIGRGRTWDDESLIGAGTSAAAGVEWRFRPKWSVGAEVERLGHKRDTSGLNWSGRTVFASANIAYRFGARGVTPYVGGGYGGAFHKGESHFGAAASTSRSSTSPMEYGTVGVEIPVGDRFAVSPEFRITFCQPPDDSAPWAATRFGIKGAIRF
jgi:hypothetical protein